MTTKHILYASLLASSLLCETSVSASSVMQSPGFPSNSAPNGSSGAYTNPQGMISSQNPGAPINNTGSSSSSPSSSSFIPPKIEEWDSLVSQLSDGMRNNLVNIIGQRLKESTSQYVDGSKKLQSDAIQRQQGILADPKTDEKTKTELKQSIAFSKLQWLALSGLVPESMKTQLNQAQQKQQARQEAAATLTENSDWATLVKASGYNDKDVQSMIAQFSNLPSDQKEKEKTDLKGMIDTNNVQIRARPNSAKVPIWQHSNAIYYLKLAILNGKAPQNGVTPVNNAGASSSLPSTPLPQPNFQGGGSSTPAMTNSNQNSPMPQNNGMIAAQNSGTSVNTGQSSSSTPLPQPNSQGGSSSTPAMANSNQIQNLPMQQLSEITPAQNPGAPINNTGSSSSSSSSSGFVPPKLEEWDSLVAQLSDGMRNNLINIIQKDIKISANPSNAAGYQKLQSDTVLRQEAFLNSGDPFYDHVALNQSIALAKLEWLALGGQYPQSFKTLLDQNAASQQARQNAAATVTATSDWQTLLTATGTTAEAAQNMIADFSKLTLDQKNEMRTESNKNISTYQMQINANPQSAKNPIWKRYIAQEYLKLAILDGKYQSAQNGTSSNQMAQQGNLSPNAPSQQQMMGSSSFPQQPQTSNNSNAMNMNNGTNPTNTSQNSMGGVNNSGMGGNTSGNIISNIPQVFPPSSNTMPQQSSRGVKTR